MEVPPKNEGGKRMGANESVIYFLLLPVLKRKEGNNAAGQSASVGLMAVFCNKLPRGEWSWTDIPSTSSAYLTTIPGFYPKSVF
jgi:hypothetical protein